MKLILTILARNEAEIIETTVRFHLDRGVDFVIVTDNGSVDATAEILREYERTGHARVISERSHSLEQGPWVTHMARAAATEHAADWVIHGDADEFFWPDSNSLKDVLAEIPKRYGVITVPRFNFLPPPETRDPPSGSFAERMLVRETGLRKRPERQKLAHRAAPNVRIPFGCHRLEETDLTVFGGWHPIEGLHFPIRSYAQWEAKIAQGAAIHRTNRPELWDQNVREPGPRALPSSGQIVKHGMAYRLWEHGQLRAAYDVLVSSDEEMHRGIRKGRLTADRRLRDALRGLGLSRAEDGDRARDDWLASLGPALPEAAEQWSGRASVGNGDHAAARQHAILKSFAGYEQDVRELYAEVKSLEGKLRRAQARGAKKSKGGPIAAEREG